MRVPPLVFVAACVAAAVTWLAAGSAPAEAENARWGANYFPNVVFTTQDGVKVRFYDDLIKGKTVAVDLIYTTCKYNCPLETARLAQVQRLLGDRMGRDVFFYSITIDPAHDTPAVLKEYATKYNAGPGWLFLTGTQADIELVGRKLGLYSEPNPANLDGHTPSLLVGNEPTGQWMRNSALDNPGFLARTIGDWMSSWRNRRPATTVTATDGGPLHYAKGEYAFSSQCAPCHSLGGRGTPLAPDLAGVVAARGRPWVERFIKEPDTVLASNDPTARRLLDTYRQVRMPRLAISDTDVNDIITFIESRPASPRGDAATTTASQPSAGPWPSSAQFAPLIPSYLEIQQALSADRLTNVVDAARAILRVADTIGPAAQPVADAARDVEHAPDLATTRAAFGPLGDAVMLLAQHADADLGREVHVAYCPMLRKYWLQKGEAIRNPYYGSAMLDCGRLEPALPSPARR